MKDKKTEGIPMKILRGGMLAALSVMVYIFSRIFSADHLGIVLWQEVTELMEYAAATAAVAICGALFTDILIKKSRP